MPGRYRGWSASHRSGFSFARPLIDQGQLSLRRPDALTVTAELRSLRRLIESRMPRIRLEDVLLDIDRRCGFTRAFRPLAGYESRGTDTYRTLLATLIAQRPSRRWGVLWDRPVVVAGSSG